MFKINKHWFVAALAAVVIMVAGGTAMADLLAYEGFNYTGTAIHGQTGGGSTGFSAAWDDTDGDFAHLTNDNTSLDSNAFPYTPSGDRIKGNGGFATRVLNFSVDCSEEGNVLFMSALLRKNSIDATSDESVHVGTTGNIFSIGITTSDKFYIRGGSSLFASSGGTAAEDTTYFLVGKLVTHSSADDNLYLKVYAPGDTVDLTEPTNWTVAGTKAMSGTIAQLELLLGGNYTDSGAIDEIRMGDTWDSVAVPEPSSVVLLVLGGLSLAAYAWRRRRR